MTKSFCATLCSRRVLVVLTLGFLACASVPPQWAPGRVSSSLVGLCPDPGDPTPQEWTTYASWGVKWVRQGFFWSAVEPQRGDWHWAWTDRYVRRAEERGLKVLAVLDYSVPWFQSLKDYLTYVRAVVQRYRGRVAAYEIWNEPNLGTFWRGSREDYLTMAKAALQVIREEDPHALTVVGALSLVPQDWLDALQKSGLLQRADFLSIHAYGIDAEASLQETDQALAFLKQHHDQAKLLVTEVGYPTGGWYPTAASPEVQAARLLQYYAGAAARGVGAVFWYTSRDQNTNVGETWNSEAYFGLETAQGTDKPAVLAYTLLAQVLPGSEFLAHGPWDETFHQQGFQVLNFQKGERLIVILETKAQSANLSLPESCRVLWPLQVSKTQGELRFPPWSVVMLESKTLTQAKLQTIPGT